jgi:hypothetical protein
VSYKSIHLYDVEFDLWNVESVGLPSVVMRGDHGEVRCCGLSKVWTVGIRQVRWYVMLESTKDRVIGVDTP